MVEKTDAKSTPNTDPMGEPIKVEIKEVTYDCPNRGRVTEKIEVKIYDTGGKPVVQVCR